MISYLLSINSSTNINGQVTFSDTALTAELKQYLYPFGMQMPGRELSQEEYRYGFQGQETDKEWLGGAVSYKYRVHDARIGRFLSVDPLAPDYPHNSPYAFSENRVLDRIELEGLEAWPNDENASPVTQVEYQVFVSGKALELVNDEYIVDTFQDCADACMLIPILYHKEKGIPFSLTVGEGEEMRTINSNNYDDYESFMNAIRIWVGADNLTTSPDLQKLDDKYSNAQPGDLINSVFMLRHI
jgi:RHS repeat-associated protein